MLDQNYQNFYNEIILKLDKKNIYTDKLHTFAYGTDASFYRLTPKIVIKTNNSDQVKDILEISSKLKLSVTFRAAGTSLSGQAITDSILIVTSRNFRGFSLSDDKSLISLEPGLTGLEANNILAPYSKKIGPDPASINAAMIGGIAANNASGMCCGIAQNSYKTVKSMKLIFQDGTRLDTSCKKSKDDFAKSNKQFLDTLKEIANDTVNNEDLRAKIEKKFKIKNTCGYSLNALIDFTDVFEILQHLIIGSEGTLAFIEEITYKTVEDLKDKASALIYFKDLKEACTAVTKLKLAREDKSINVEAVELMDRAGLRSIQNDPAMPEFIKDFDDNITALLIETRATSKTNLQKQTKEIQNLLEEFEVVREIYFTDDVKEYTLYWKIRKGLFPAVGAVRKTGTTVIIEDVAYPIEVLADATLELQELFKKHNYSEALIFGHALEGNFHFVFTQDFSIPSEVQRYDDFMNDVVSSVAVKYQGSLKAEHGTGRNMAAFVEVEWGKTAYSMMKRIKNLFDPHELLNPGVIINDDKEVHLKNLKTMPATNEIVDKCIECGFCEPTCPSNELSLTPRQRIVVNREMSRLEELGEFEEAKQYKDLYQYDGLETCATCSLCSSACPVKIDTGALTKHLRAEQISPLGNKVASLMANNFSGTLSAIKFGLKASNLTHKVLGDKTYTFITKTARSVIKTPYWSKTLPSSTSINKNFRNKQSKQKVVYFPSCITRSMGQSEISVEEKSLYEVSIELLSKAGFEIILPKTLNDLCCGMPFASKGFKKQGDLKAKQLEKQLLEASNNGEFPILCDTSPCTKRMLESFETKFKLYEPIEFCLEVLPKYLTFTKISDAIAIHTTCSSRKMGVHEKFLKLANMCSSDVTSPENVKCCGFAGDRGFNYPELNAAALVHLKPSLKPEIKYAFSTSKTCEIGLSEYSGIDYNSIMYLVNKCTSAKS